MNETKLKDFEEEIYKCSRCGLCQSVCPVYKAALNECAVSKAKFSMLNGIIKGDLSLNKKIKSYLDLCTGCNACKDFCPSQIDARKIFLAAKSDFYKTNNLSLWEKVISSYALFKFALSVSKIYFSINRALHLYKIFDVSKKFILKFGLLGKRFLLLDSFSEKKYTYKSTPAPKTKTLKALYFDGCFNKYINDETKDSVKKVLESLNIELINRNFECCGVSYLNDGMFDQFKKVIKKNLSAAGTENSSYDYVLTDCASCYDVLKGYKDFDESAGDFSQKTVSVFELIKDIKFTSKYKKPDGNLMKIAVHVPCHEKYDIVSFIKNIENTDYVEALDFDKCCGFSGKFALKNQEISREISRQKATNYIEAKADIILTTCPACLLGLRQGMLELSGKYDKTPEVMNLFVFLAKYCCD